MLYRELLDDKTEFSSITAVVFRRIGHRIKDEFILKKAEEFFRAQVGKMGVDHYSPY